MISERAFRVNLRNFKINRDSASLAHWRWGEVEEFEREREKLGKKAEDFVTQCYVFMKHSHLACAR